MSKISDCDEPQYVRHDVIHALAKGIEEAAAAGSLATCARLASAIIHTLADMPMTEGDS